MVIRNLAEELLAFCENHKNIYLYGAGEYAKTLYSFISNNGVEINGIVTTSGGDGINGYSSIKARELVTHEEDGIILGLNEKHSEEVVSENDFKCNVFRFSDYDYYAFESSLILGGLNMFSSAHEADRGRRIESSMHQVLIIQCEVTFGDMIWSTAFLRELRRNLPKAVIDVIINSKLKDIYKECPYIDHIYEMDCHTVSNPINEAIISEVRLYYKKNIGKTYDAVFLPRLLPVNLSDSWENVVLAMESGARARYAHAYYVTTDQKARVDSIQDFFTRISRHTTGQHEVLNDLNLITENGGVVQDERMELWPSEEDQVFADYVLKGLEFLIAVAPVGSVPKKNYSPHAYGRVFKWYIERVNPNVTFVIMGGRDAIDSASVISEYIPDNRIDLTNKTSLNQAAAVISRCGAYIGADTGLLHMASAFRKPIIELTFTSKSTPTYIGSSPIRVGPVGKEDIVLYPKRMRHPCSVECFAKESHCINEIDEEEIKKALLTTTERIHKGATS